MKTIIVGAGLTGVQLAKRLIAEKHDVVLIDSDEETVRHASNRLDCMVIQANGNNLPVLEEAGIEKADALVAVTDSDEVNMITCMLADNAYPGVIKIARVRNDEYYADSRQSAKARNDAGLPAQPLYGIDFMVHPDIEAAEAIINAVEHGAVSDILLFDNSDFELTSITVEQDRPLDGMCVRYIRQKVHDEFLVVFIETDEEAALPSGDTVLHAETRIAVLTHRETLPRFFELAGSSSVRLKKIALVGAGRIGTLVADHFAKKTRSSAFPRFFGVHQKANKYFVIIDKDSAAAKAAAERYPGATVYNADVTDEGFIEEEGIAEFDLVIAATNNHELNMITSAYFKSIGVGKTVSLVSSGGFAYIGRKIGIDVAIPVKEAVVDSILGHLRGGSVKEVHTIAEGELEIIKLVIPPSSKIVGKTLKDIAVHGSFLVLLAQKEDSFFIPSGETVLEEGTKLIFIVRTADNKEVQEKFEGGAM